jgi:hypothetical protein
MDLTDLLDPTNMNNIVLQKMLQIDGMPLTAEKYVELAYWGQRTLADLEGEELADVADFESDVRRLLGEEDE